MNKNNLNRPDPEEFWPEARTLIDGHYRRKRRKRVLIWLFVLVFLSSAGLWFYNNIIDQSPSRLAESGHRTPKATDTDTKDKPALKRAQPVQKPKTAYTAGSTSADKASAGKVAVVNAERKTGQLKRSGNNMPLFERDRVQNKSHSIVQDIVVHQDHNQYSSLHTEPVLPMSSRKSIISAISIGEAEVIKGQDGEKQVNLIKKSKSTSMLHVYGGLAQINHTVINPGNDLYTRRREKEESPAILPLTGLQWVRESRLWGTRIGVELAVMGEKTGYSPWLFGDYTSTSGTWNPTTLTVTDTDSAYIYGMLFYNISNRITNDSVYTLNTDTLQGLIYDNQVLEANGINRKYILQVPVEVSYRLTGNRLSLSAIVGVLPGVNVRSRGRYLTRDERGFYHYNESSRRQFTLGVGAGLECRYQLGEFFRLSFSTRYRHQLLHYREENGVDLIYRSLGVQGGLMFILR